MWASVPMPEALPAHAPLPCCKCCGAKLRCAPNWKSKRQIAETLPSLTEAENAELIALLASENARMDQDIAACRAEAQRIAAEEAQARHIKPLKFPLSRTASRILQDEIERRLSRGHCPPVELLTEQAIRAVDGE